MSTPNERLALLRGLLHAAPSLWGWTQLCALFEGWPDDGTREVGLEYALQTLNAGWEDALRPPPQAWRAAWLAGAPPLGWPLVRAFDVILEDSGPQRLAVIRIIRGAARLFAARRPRPEPAHPEPPAASRPSRPG
jgi:hypothetical protein